MWTQVKTDMQLHERSGNMPRFIAFVLKKKKKSNYYTDWQLVSLISSYGWESDLAKAATLQKSRFSNAGFYSTV